MRFDHAASLLAAGRSAAVVAAWSCTMAVGFIASLLLYGSLVAQPRQ